MEESNPEVGGFSTAKISEFENNNRFCSPGLTINQISPGDVHYDAHIPEYFHPNLPCRVRRASQESVLPGHTAQECEDDKGAKPHLGSAGRECCCWNCVANRHGTAEPVNREASGGEVKYKCGTESDEEDLEAPLPLRSDEELRRLDNMHTFDLHPATDVRCCPYQGLGLHDLHPVNRQPLQSRHQFAPCQHRSPWLDQQHWLCSHDPLTAVGGVSVNVPQFFVPPVDSMSQVSVMDLRSAEATGFVSDPCETRRTVGLPKVSRNVFITYSSDISPEILPFTDFLTKRGFQPAVDILDDPVRSMDVNKWKDSHLMDPSTLIIIAISPQYKADIEGSVVDGRSVHTRYIYATMQNEFIQQGSLNYRFIPVLFLNASQKHVPRWLQNTRVYRWPQDTEDLLLRLLREEKYIPPPVPVDLTLIIKPVAAGL
ncbi:E3 ubiquitin ligase TRAF3IP2-like isoform X1 [Nelusetta ayraudi]|uniref:E3 ubiquitin ligase TRAF3IP2-like isoform X1 n=1 Tax=Nelusetta ayraudi TaxID=303726 RepID=UPI003F6EB3A0